MFKRNILIAFICLSTISFSYAQGLSNLYSFGRGHAVGGSIIYDGKDFVVSGIVTSDSLPQRVESLWAKIDTDGNVISFKPFKVSGSDVNSFSNTLIRDKNGDYLNTGYMGHDIANAAFLLKLNPLGDTIFFKRYYDSLSWSFQSFALIQHSDGYYYMTGSLGYSSYANVPLLKIDSGGNLVKKTYYNTGWGQLAQSLIELPNHNILLGSWRSNQGFRQPNQKEWSHSYFFEVDTGGNLIRQWMDPNDSTYYPTRMMFLPDSNFVYTTAYCVQDTYDFGQYYDPYYGTYFVKRDLNFNKIWEVKLNMDPGVWLAEPTFDTTSSGDFIVVHETYSIPVRGNYLVTKVSSIGDILWQKMYYPIDTFFDETYPSCVKILPNGNIVVWGEFRPAGIYNNEAQQAWLLVLDSNGCLNPNCSTGWVEEEVFNNKLKVFPIPMRDIFRIEIENPEMQGGNLEIYDINGRKLLEATNNYTRQMMIDVNQWNNGIYLWRYTKESQAVQSGKVVKE